MAVFGASQEYPPKMALLPNKVWCFEIDSPPYNRFLSRSITTVVVLFFFTLCMRRNRSHLICLTVGVKKPSIFFRQSLVSESECSVDLSCLLSTNECSSMKTKER